ncbi:transcription factor DUO1-like [Rhododendron vialii]|uniref:transcription factor DUO1-like n=1 Tax=Rhododendron vialii TaxID=182163 RepID=UPI00265FD05F|nr:transcription factor DUO1-like [Rhododendron vialii]
MKPTGNNRGEILEIGDEIKKGPWNAEEDEVLVRHVNKYGPRDWSSIRSKGLLQRTGKSCRLRWVNKLRPNLKNGMKFSAEEERMVIELQGQFGNKWARIASCLPGRTDNDVKNFWSSRQKRLTRILRTPSTPRSSSSKLRTTNAVDVLQSNLPTLIEAPKLSSSPVSEEPSSLIDNDSQMIKIVPQPDRIKSDLIRCDQQLLDQSDFHLAVAKNLVDDSHPQFTFPSIPDLQQDFPPAFANEVPINFLDEFGNVDASEIGNIAQFPFAPSYLGPCLGGNCASAGRGRNANSAIFPDGFFCDFPADIFDHMEPIPSPSEWG